MIFQKKPLLSNLTKFFCFLSSHCEAIGTDNALNKTKSSTETRAHIRIGFCSAWEVTKKQALQVLLRHSQIDTDKKFVNVLQDSLEDHRSTQERYFYVQIFFSK